MVGLPVTFCSLCLEAYPTLSPQLENEVAVPVQVCKPLKLCPSASVVLCISQIIFHVSVWLVNKLELVTIADNLRSAAQHDAVVLIAAIAALDATQIYLNVPIPTIGNKKPCVSHSLYGLGLERHVLLVWFWSVLRWLGGVLRLNSLLRCLHWLSLLLLFLPCIHEGDAVRVDGDLRVALALPVFPLRRGDGALHEDEPALGEILCQADVVLPAAAYPYPCCDVLSLGVVINGDVHRHECSVCACDGLAVLADATDGVRVNHNSEMYSWLGLPLTLLKCCGILFPFFGNAPKGRKKKAHLAFFFEVFFSSCGDSSFSGVS